ncbi:unnamed protein product, partial [Staurois parvus]
MRGDQRVNYMECFTRGRGVCFTVSTLIWMAVLCTAIPGSVPELTGRKTVCKQNNLPPSWRCSVITGCRR